MPPRSKPTLPASLFTSANKLPSALATPAGGHPATRPEEITLVLSGTAGHKASDQAIQQWLARQDGFSQGKDGKKSHIKSVVYQLAKGETVEVLDKMEVALTTSGIPITAVTALLDLPPTLPPPSAPPHNSLCFSIPTITKVSQIKDSLPQWNEVLHKAHETTYTLEFNLSEDEKVRESFEELLGKDFELNSKDEQQKEGDAEVDTSKGAKFVIDNFGSPPLNLSSSELLRSDSLRNWAEFMSHLALHPRIFVKLSPLSLPSSILPSSSPASSRPSDSTSKISDTVTSVTQGIKDIATSISSSTESDARSELGRRMRIFLDVLLEAFGEERLIWATKLDAGDKVAVGSEKVDTGLDQSKEWFELVREKFADMGVETTVMDKIFKDNASKVYRL